MPVPLARVEIAFGSDPSDPSQDWIDVTDRVLGMEGVECSRGRADEMSACEPGTASLTFDNSTGAFTWGYAGSPFFPNVKPGKLLRIEVSADGGLTWWPRFTGPIDGWPTAFADDVAVDIRCPITAVDRLSRLSGNAKLRHPIAHEFGTATSVVGSRLG